MPRKPKVSNRKTIPIQTGDIFDNDGNVVGRIPIGEENEDIQIEVADNESKPPSLKDRFFSTFETPKEPKKPWGRVSKSTQNDLIAKALPTLFTTLIVQLSRNLVPDPYKQACPTKEEVEAILQPFFSILSRRIKVSVGASRDALDIIACLTASVTYGTRALITVEVIKKEVKSDDRTRVSREDNRITRNNESEAATNYDHANSQNSDTSDSKGETQLFSDLFRRDIDGRRQMGLLNRGL